MPGAEAVTFRWPLFARLDTGRVVWNDIVQINLRHDGLLQRSAAQLMDTFSISETSIEFELRVVRLFVTYSGGQIIFLYSALKPANPGDLPRSQRHIPSSTLKRTPSFPAGVSDVHEASLGSIGSIATPCGIFFIRPKCRKPAGCMVHSGRALGFALLRRGKDRSYRDRHRRMSYSADATLRKSVRPISKVSSRARVYDSRPTGNENKHPLFLGQSMHP